ncbi:MAG TPA: ABC transporter permease [Bacteroidales bacterium]|nr:ABC transporter permease [Bacteroidales bacterium]
MKLFSVITKSFREQVRSYWVLLLSLIMGPFFIFVYYLIVESSKPGYDVLVLNNDKGYVTGNLSENMGRSAIAYISESIADSSFIPVRLKEITDRETGISSIKNKESDALIIFPPEFSSRIRERINNDSTGGIPVEIVGDVTSAGYLLSAIWVNETINNYLNEATGNKNLLDVHETALGSSAGMDDFDMIVPGLLIISLIMLMFTASIAFVSEVENKTILRLRLSDINAWEFLGGIGFVQTVVGILSMILTLLTAVSLGFDYRGSLWIMLLIAGLTSISIISFSLIIAAVTKSTNEVLIVGNFPMFLFMFFTGAAFPMKAQPLFTFAGYPVSVQSLMSPVHAISALNKTLVMDMDVISIVPEIVSLVLLSIIYFLIGAYIFNRRHLKLA